MRMTLPLAQGSMLFRPGGQNVSVNVVDFQLTVLPKPHVTYCVCVTEKHRNASPTSYRVMRRFNQFKELHKRLMKVLPKSAKSLLPKLPSAGWRRSFESEFISRRRKELDMYIVKLAGVLSGADDVTQTHQQPFISFLATSSEDSRLGDQLPIEGPVARESRGSSYSGLSEEKTLSSSGREGGSPGGGDNAHGNEPLQPLADWSGVHISLITDPRPDPGQRVATKIGIGLQRFVCGTCGGTLNARRSKDVVSRA
jgi:hypothetical protein